MELLFTPGAQRALIEAAAWSSGIESPELETPALLLGLLSESECRAALMLTACGVDPESVRKRWPGLNRQPRPAGSQPAPLVDLDRPGEIRKRLPRFSDELLMALAAIRRRLYDYPRPLVLATEHLLMGLAATGKDVSRWLRDQGIDPDALHLEIRRRDGCGSAGLSVETSAPGDTCVATAVCRQIEGAGQQEAEPEQETERVAAELAPRGPSPVGSQHGAPGAQVAALRVVDAAANRATEGLRVLEDYVRFVLDNRHLTEQLKLLRHSLADALARVSVEQRLAARETQADVGTPLTTASERAHPRLTDVLIANFVRVQEALRSLEEFGKLLDADLGDRAKRLRYRAYTLQRAVQITTTSLERLDRAHLYVLVEGGSSESALESLVRGLVRAGVHVIQLRDKRLPDRPLLDRAKLLRRLTAGTQTLFIVNDRPDLAALAGADGVHVGQEELSVKEARTIVGTDALVGVSIHSIERARQAVLDGANYLGVGPTFPSETKQFAHFPGLDLVRAVAQEIRLPAFAIGGINAGNVSQVIEAGLRRVAVSGAIATASDPAAAAKELLAALAAS